ncbi:MAG: hypothetical protein WCF84_18070 [Anaerolineae bacterium]
MADKTILLLGGAGLVGTQVAREAARQLHPEKVIIASLYQREVREALALLQKEYPQVTWVGVWGDVFVRADFTHAKRSELLQSSQRRDDLYDDMISDTDRAYGRSRLVQLILEHRPDVIVDSINTATAISYQDVYAASVIAKQRMDVLLARIEELAHSVKVLTPAGANGNTGDVVVSPIRGEEAERTLAALQSQIAEIARLRKPTERAIETLLISQAIPQLVRHVVLILRAMQEAGTRLYLKIGTTGTGGMGLNIPYTHGEDKPSAKLMSKTAVGFAHTGLMFLMARTPQTPIVKEIKPAAMIGYADISVRAISEHGEPVMRHASKAQKLNGNLVLHADPVGYPAHGKLEMVIADTGENGFFTHGELECITAMRQMEFITPEEIAHKVVLEIQGHDTGADVISAIDGAVLNPTYRGGMLRRAALDELTRLEEETGIPSIALGQLGPPELSKLLFEAYLLKDRYHTLARVLNQRPKKIADALYNHLHKHREIREMITSVGVPILMPDGKNIWRGPLIRIPERHDTNEVPLTPENIDLWAHSGWVDLRPENFIAWRERFDKMQRAQEKIRGHGSAAVTMEAYLSEEINIGEVVAWIFNNEKGGYRIK